MDLSAPTLWWLAAGALVIAELTSGTFYLLMLALGCAAGAVAGHMGLGLSGQIMFSALVGGGATAGWHFRRASRPRSAPARTNADANIDIGQTLQVLAWNDDGTARVPYRGAAWAVQYAGSGTPQPGLHVIVGMQGSQLQVAPAP